VKPGDKVRYTVNDRIGTCRGPIRHFTVMWMIVDWDDGCSSYVLEDYLEVVNESG